MIEVRYRFIFEPDEMGLGRVGDFDSAIGKFFMELGLESNLVETLPDQSSDRVIILTKKVELIEELEKPENKSMKKLATAKAPRDSLGKFLGNLAKTKK